MIILPSTTKVNQRIPKESFYRHIKLNAKEKNEFVQIIESVTVTNSIKATTTNLDCGANVDEILVLLLELKVEKLPVGAIEAIAKNNPNELLFDCRFGDRTSYAIFRSGEVWSSKWFVSGSSEEVQLRLKDARLDGIWDAFCAQLLFGSNDIEDVDAEIARKRRIRQLEAEIFVLQRKHGNVKQMNRRNELYKLLSHAKSELESLVRG